MQDHELSKIIEKIRKLLALSKSSNQAEAAAALNKANELLLQYNLSMDQIKTTDSDPIELRSKSLPGNFDFGWIFFFNSRSRDKYHFGPGYVGIPGKCSEKDPRKRMSAPSKKPLPWTTRENKLHDAGQLKLFDSSDLSAADFYPRVFQNS